MERKKEQRERVEGLKRKAKKICEKGKRKFVFLKKKIEKTKREQKTGVSKLVAFFF